MTYKFHMNGVITGSINSFCLACESFLESTPHATKHIGTSKHKKKIAAVPYFDKFKDEHIRKFKGGYYCEFCNLLLPIASKVNIHITEDDHKHNKGILLLNSFGGGVVAFNNIRIERKAWHGLIDGVCSLCNAEFDDEEDHLADANHCLNLVLKPVQFVADSAIYRNLDDTAAQCLTCNKMLAPGNIIKHFEDPEHHDIHAKCRFTFNTSIEFEENNNIQEIQHKGDCQEIATKMTSVIPNTDEIQKPKIENGSSNNEKPVSKDKSKILEAIVKYQSKGININLETETAFCKKCSQVIKFDSLEIESHIENHSSAVMVDSDLHYPSNLNQNLNRLDINDKTTQASDDIKNTDVLNETKEALQAEDQVNSSDQEDNDADTEKVEVSDFAKANKITYNKNNNQSYCRICKVHVPASLRSMKEHVEGINHKKLAGSSVAQPNKPGWQVKQTTKDFVDESYIVQSAILNTVCIINEKHCISQKGFCLISGNYPRMRCLLCEINLPPFSDMEDHAKSTQHVLKWQRVPVIISEKNEFIREVRPGLYHCGYCNLAVTGWDDMKRHLECSDHRENRSVGERQLSFHMPNLQRYKFQEQMEAMVMMRLFNTF